MTTSIAPQTFQFLRELGENNHREWFEANKARYQKAHENMIGFADAFLAAMQSHDRISTPSGKKSLYRIYRDVRFSNDKSPYKTHFGGYFRRATDLLRGGYFFHFGPDASHLAGGFWRPNSQDLKRIREEIAGDPDELRAVLAKPELVATFGELRGEKVRTAPKGYKKDDPAIDLLRYKQFILRREFSDAELHAPNFLDKAVQTYLQLRPFFDYMSAVLTTDANGVPLIN